MTDDEQRLTVQTCVGIRFELNQAHGNYGKKYFSLTIWFVT